MKCVIIDDEPKAIAVLQRYVEKIDDLELLSAFDRPLEAIQFLRNHKPDCLFLDINMPEVSGLQLVALIQDIPVVFTTAYPQFALESYELSAIDYLLKPIALPRFLKAVDKLRSTIIANNSHSNQNNIDYSVLIKSGNKTYKIAINQIRYMETLGNNIVIHTSDINVTTRLTVRGLYETIPMNRFIRIHKSFIVAKNEVQVIESHQITTKSGITLPIGDVYRNDLKVFLQQLKPND